MVLRHDAYARSLIPFLMRTVACLYIDPRGPYPKLPGTDCWDEKRDARLYAGPHPVVAHPPCERWGRYWGGGPMLHGTERQKVLGDDGGCFAAALASVRQWGGVLEHPEASHAWKAHGLSRPPKSGGWVPAGDGGFTCCVEQGHYGHAARKATWLYAARVELPELTWGNAEGKTLLDEGFHSKEERARLIKTGRCQRLSRLQRIKSPVPFAELLLNIARSSRA